MFREWGWSIEQQGQEAISKDTAQCPWIKGKKLLNATSQGSAVRAAYIAKCSCIALRQAARNVTLAYLNLRNVTVFVCPATPQPFTDRRAPNSAGRSGRGTKNTSRKQIFKIPTGCHGNCEILSRLRYLSDGAEFFTVESTA